MTSRIAVITGAGSGMGRAIALRFAAAGVGTVLVGRTEGKLRAVAEEVVASGGEAEVYALDVCDDAAVARLGEALDGTRVDVLVNCAGDWLISGLADTTNAQLDHILAVNLRAPYIVSRTLLPMLKRSDKCEHHQYRLDRDIAVGADGQRVYDGEGGFEGFDGCAGGGVATGADSGCDDLAGTGGYTDAGCGVAGN